MTDPKIKYDIEAAVKGEPDVEQLAKVLRDLSGTLDGDLAKSAGTAADALESLASKQTAITTFTALKRESTDLATSLDAAAAKVEQLGTALPQAAQATADFSAAEAQARTAMAATQAILAEQRQALVALRTEYTGSARGTDDYKTASAQLQVTIKSLRQTLADERAEVATAATATKTAQTAEKALSTEYDNSVKSARNLSAELGNKNRALATSRDALKATGVESTNLAQAERNLETAIVQVRQQVASLAPAYQAATAASAQSTAAQVQNQRTLREGMTSISTTLANIRNIATAAIGGSFITGLAKDVAATADEFNNLQARIQLVTGGGQQFVGLFEDITKVALDTHSALDTTGTLFTRIAQASKEAGLNAQQANIQALGLTQTINQTVQLSGSSAEASNAAITQLIQGLQSGVLRGDEFNSVMEQAPRLAKALADGLGVTTGELRKMAEQGALTSKTVISALQGQSDVVATEFAKLPLTVGRSLQDLSTRWTLYVGEADKGSGATASAAKIIEALSKNIDVLVNTLYAAGKGFAAFKIAGLAVDVANWAKATQVSVAATEASTVAVVRNTTATAANTVAQAENATVQRAAAAAATAQAAAQGTAAAAAEASRLRYAALVADMNAVRTTQTATTATTTAATAAQVALASQATKTGLVWAGVSKLFGPLGLVIGALAPEILNVTRSVGEAAAKWAGWGKVLQDNEDKLRSQDLAIKEATASQLRIAAAMEAARNKTFDLSKEAVNLIGKFDGLVKGGDTAADAIGKIGKDFDLATVPGIKNAAGVLDKLAADGKLSAAEFKAAWATALDGKDLAVFETQARAAFSGSSREAERLAELLDATVREAVRRTGLDFVQLQGGIGTAARSAINDVEQIVQGLGRLSAQGVDTARLLTTSIGKAIDTADSQKAVDTLRVQIEGLRSKLGDKITDGLLDQAAQKALALKAALDAATPGINSVAEAFKQLGITAPAELDRIAKANSQAWDLIKIDGTVSADNLAKAFQAYAESAVAASGKVGGASKELTESLLQNQAAAKGLQISFDATGKAIVTAIGGASDSLNGLTGATNTNTAARYSNVSAIDAQTAALARQAQQDKYGKPVSNQEKGLTGDGFKTNKDGSAAGTFTNTAPVDVAFAIAAKQQAGTITAADLADAKTALAQAQTNSKIQTQSTGASAEGISSAMNLLQLTTAALDAATGKANQAAAKATTAAGPGGVPAPVPAPAPAPAPAARTVNFNITFDGQSFGSVPTTDAGAGVLQDLINQLSNAKRGAGL